jgi:hypothetical protein
MKQGLYILAVALGLVSFGTHAEEAVKQEEAKPSVVVRLGGMELEGSEDKYSPKDFPNGIFILAGGKPLFRDFVNYDKVAKLFEKKMQDKGFKIIEKREDADAVFIFNSSVKFPEIQAGEIDKLKRGLSILDDIAGIALGAKLSGNKTILTNGVNINLYKERHVLDIKVEKKGMKEALSRAHFNTEISEVTPTAFAALVGVMFDEWAKVHIEL